MVDDKNDVINAALTGKRHLRDRQISRLLRRHSVAFAFFVLLAFLTLYPILFNNGSRVAGYDYYNSNWSMWWIRHALTTPGQNVYQTNFGGRNFFRENSLQFERS